MTAPGGSSAAILLDLDLDLDLDLVPKPRLPFGYPSVISVAIGRNRIV